MNKSFSILLVGILIGINWGNPLYGHGGEEHTTTNPSKSTALALPSNFSQDLSLIQRVFVPKDVQFSKGMTTLLAKRVERPTYKTLSAKVLASPTGYAQVQVAQPSRVVADASYPMPNTGDSVEMNQVIAVIEPLWTAVDLVDKKKELYKIEGEITELEREIKRLTILGAFAPAFKLDFAKTNIERAKRQKDQILQTGLIRTLVRAPISGTLSDSHILPGQIIQPGQALAEIVNPSSLRIESYTFDYDLAEKITSASLKSPTNPEIVYPLTLIGLSPKVGENDQSRHVLFDLKKPHDDLMIGMVVEVIAETQLRNEKLVIPQSALLKSGKNYSVFVLNEAELILAKSIEVGLFFDQSVEVLEGLESSDRVIETTDSVAAALSALRGHKNVH